MRLRSAMRTDSAHSSLETVEVPDSVPPGGQFTVQLLATRNRQQVGVAKQLWRSNGNAPVIVKPMVENVDGQRQALRPSSVARVAGGSRTARSVDHTATQIAEVAEWSTTDPLPFEVTADDVGWLPGPVNGPNGRPMPVFSGHARGVRDPQLACQASARQIMRSVQLSREFKSKVVLLAREHATLWKQTHRQCDGIERAWQASNLRDQHVELWFAATVRLAALNPAVPAKSLWDPSHKLYDAELDAALPYDVWRWLNRHLAFGGVGEAVHGGTAEAVGDGSGASGAVRDQYRKRREVSDIARATASRVWWPGQHVGFDDLVRVTRHWEGRRVRDKAAVHTGRRGDGLNDAHSHYFMWWEERGWQLPDVATVANVEEEDAESASGGRGVGSGGATGAEHGSGAVRRLVEARGGRGGRGRHSRGGRGSCEHAGAQRGRPASTMHGSRTPAQPGGGLDGRQAIPHDEESASEAESGDAIGSGSNSVLARLLRACNTLEPQKGHCIWIDRGLASVQAMQATRRAGFHITGMMQSNRIGLPRRYLAHLKRQLKCPRGCSHTSNSVGCKRWSWTCLHKGDWELHCWSDGKELVTGLTSCASGTRTVPVYRTVGSEIRLVQCPEAIGLYNSFGRGPTDGGDQRRKQLSLAVRRRLRQGPKGALFDAEIGFVNGSIVASELRGSPVTVWDLSSEFATDVIAAVSMRRRTSPMLATAAGERVTRAQERAHEPINFADARRKRRRTTDAALPVAKRGKCCCLTGSCERGEPKRPAYFCPGCHAVAGNGWYHWSCYWQRHRAVVVE